MRDRRHFLGNAAAAAFLTQISPLRSFGFGTEGQETIDPTISDRAKAGLRGPVKMCVEEKTRPPDGKGEYWTTTEYRQDGRLLTTRYANSDGSEWVTTQIYDADGRLQKITSGKVGEPCNELLYAYDGGRLLAITSNPEKGGRTDYQYDEQGRKTSVQSFDPEALKRAQSTSYAGSLWDAAGRSGIGVPIGGNIITIYNDKDLPTEEQLRDGQSRIVTRIVRNYDANGRIIEEKQIQENPASIFFDKAATEGQPQLTAAQFEAMNKHMKWMLSGRNGTGTSYSYDNQGRVTEMRERNFWFERLTTTSYNEQGDKSDEHQSMANNLTVPAGVAFSMDENGEFVQSNPAAKPTKFPEEFFGETKVTYTYEYDGYGNWTQSTVNHKSGLGEASSICYRKLTYY